MKRKIKPATALSCGLLELCANAVGVSMLAFAPPKKRRAIARKAAKLGKGMNLPGKWGR